MDRIEVIDIFNKKSRKQKEILKLEKQLYNHKYLMNFYEGELLTIKFHLDVKDVEYVEDFEFLLSREKKSLKKYNKHMEKVMEIEQKLKDLESDNK